MPSLHSPFFSLRGACLTMRGAAAPSALPEASRQTWLLPPSEGAPPLRPREFMRGWQPLHPPAGAPREHGKAMLGTRVTFPSRGKSPKARQGLRPLESPEGDRLKSETLFSPAPPAASRNPLDRDSDTTKDRFATLSLWANRSCFFPLVSSREHSLFSICGSAGLPPRMLEGLSSRNQYR